MRLTPRSNEALKRTGYVIDDLRIKSIEEINSKYNDNVTDAGLLKKRHDHYEEKRKEKISTLKKVRNDVVE